MSKNDHTDDDVQYDDDGFSENQADDMSPDEIREEALAMIAECDGALIITATLCDDDESVEGAAIKFVRDDLPDDDRHSLNGSLLSGANRVAPGGMSLGDGENAAALEALLGAMLSGGSMPDGDDDGDGFESMFA